MIKKLRRTVPEDDADDNEYQSSCKLKIILKLLERFDGLHRVLIFSQTREMLDAIEVAISRKGYKYSRIDGSMPRAQRTKIIDAFKEEGGDPIFLISSLSGGTGLDLPVASRTIIVEPAWNPCIDDQCTDRIYRLGQLKDVIIYRLITSETIEEHVYRKQLFKASIFKAATEQKNFKRYVIKQMRSEFFKLPPNGFSISRTQKMLEKETMHGVLPQEVKKELRFLEKQGTAGVTIHNKLFAETIDVPVCKSHESYQLRSGTKQQPHGGYSSAAVKKGAEFVVKSRFAFEPEDDAAAARKARESRIKYLEGEVKRLTYNYVANGIKLPDRVKVYGWAISPFVSRALLCLEEAGVEYELVPMSRQAGDHRRPEHLARNPFGQVPVLEDGDLTLFESRAIARHVLRKHKPELLGQGNLVQSAMVDVWLEVEAHQFHPAAGAIVVECVFAPLLGRARDQAAVDENAGKLRAVLEVYEARLAQSRYLAGDFLSLADLSHFTLMHYFMATEYAALVEALPHVKAWWEELAARPAARKVAEFMPLEFGVPKKEQ